MNASDELSVLYGSEKIDERVRQIGADITSDFPESDIACVGVLPNCMVFMADLIRKIERPLTCDFLKVGTDDAKRVDIAFGQANDFSDRDVLLIQGVVDTGVTLDFITGHIEQTWRPKSLKVAALINRENHRKVGCAVDYTCFELSMEGYVAGYGLGLDEYHRGATYLGLAGAEAS